MNKPKKSKESKKLKRPKRQGGMRRPCERCDKYFMPSSRGTRICDGCVNTARDKRFKNNKKIREERERERKKHL